MEFKDAFDRVILELQKDEQLFYAYQANIAMAFQDEMAAKGYKFPDLHEISNTAAKIFLNRLIARSESVSFVDKNAK